jgi:F0F1-type ATP synthase membrane subunit b/b'
VVFLPKCKLEGETDQARKERRQQRVDQKVKCKNERREMESQNRIQATECPDAIALAEPLIMVRISSIKKGSLRDAYKYVGQ